jgi:hypothetical protein
MYFMSESAGLWEVDFQAPHHFAVKIDTARSSETTISLHGVRVVPMLLSLTEHHAMKAYWGAEV